MKKIQKISKKRSEVLRNGQDFPKSITRFGTKQVMDAYAEISKNGFLNVTQSANWQIFALSQKVSKKLSKFQNFDLFEGDSFFLKQTGHYQL